MYLRTALNESPVKTDAGATRLSKVWAGLFFVLLPCVEAAMAAQLQPFRAQNHSPFFLGAGLPPAESPFLSPGGSAYVQLDIVNNAVARESDRESVSVDGETYRTVLGLRRALGASFEIGVDVPWIAHSPGALDNFIEDWHDFFGLSNSEREPFAPNQLDYRYSREATLLSQLDQRYSGVGDVQLSAAWQFLRGTDTAATLRATLDLATGEAEHLSGSGGTELALSLTVGDNALFARSNLAGALSVGVLGFGRGDVLAEQQEGSMFFGSAFFAWAIVPSLAFKAQLDGHTPGYESELTPLGGAGIQLTVGGQAELSRHWSLDFAIGENLHTGATPDVVFHFALTHRGQ